MRTLNKKLQGTGYAVNQPTNSQFPDEAFGYRPDIDGLRAVAVLAVLGFHFTPGLIKGGFVGVDIFFVISGYLITNVLLRSLSDGHFSIADFYSRRVRRIFPALIAIFAASYILGWFTLYSDEYRDLGKHMLAGAAFLSNFTLLNEGGYFDRAAEAKPLLHLWSLGIEEQFYIFWPLVLWFAHKRQLNLFIISLFIALVSFYLNIATLRGHPLAAFYSPATRAWELLSGGLLAYFTKTLPPAEPIRTNISQSFFWTTTALNNVKVNLGKITPNVQAIAGTLLVGCSLVFISKEKAFPGWWAVLPVAGATLLICAGRSAWVNKVILSHPTLVWFGMISYPLYLWHWPILYFTRIIFGDEPTRPVRLTAIILSVALGWLTYRFIEKPIRLGRNRRGSTAMLSLGLATVACIGAITFYLEGLTFRYVQPNDYANRQWTLKVPGTKDCSSIVSATVDGYCAKTQSPATVAIVGDSHGGQLLHGFVTSGDPEFNKVFAIIGANCPPALGVDTRVGCNQLNEIAMAEVARTTSIKYLVVGAYYTYIDQANSPWSDKLIAGYRKTFDAANAGKKTVKIVFVIDNPALKKSAEECVPAPFKIRTRMKTYPAFCDGATDADLMPRPEYLKFVARLQAEFPSVVFYDPRNALCSEDGKCKLFNDSKLLMGDTNHLSIYGSSYVVNDLIEQLKKVPR
ncbi:MAG: acyltransferase family protein [Pseudomonadota bacterium]